MKRIKFHEEAEAEIIEAARYYEAKAPGLGVSFLLDAEDAVDQIATRPEAFQVVTGNVRRKLLRHFPYNVLFAIEPDRIRVLAVGHQKRRSGYWRHRLQ